MSIAIIGGTGPQGSGIGLRLADAGEHSCGVGAGALRLARLVEPFTAVLISMNKRYKTNTSVYITGIRQNGDLR